MTCMEQDDTAVSETGDIPLRYVPCCFQTCSVKRRDPVVAVELAGLRVAEAVYGQTAVVDGVHGLGGFRQRQGMSLAQEHAQPPRNAVDGNDGKIREKRLRVLEKALLEH